MKKFELSRVEFLYIYIYIKAHILDYIKYIKKGKVNNNLKTAAYVWFQLAY